MNRPSRNHTLMETAWLWADRSTCARLTVGCVISRGGRILVQGYNGAPSGLPHCDFPHEPEQCLAVHAEQNAISWAARVGVALEGSEMVCTHQPCLSCARSIINAGIESVIYDQEYRLTEGIELLTQAGISVHRLVALRNLI